MPIVQIKIVIKAIVCKEKNDYPLCLPNFVIILIKLNKKSKANKLMEVHQIYCN